jgi:hypothetical protein
MPGFVIFIIILVVIWTIIATTTATNKQKELERRRRLQEELQRMAMQRAGVVAPARPRQISRGIAQRFPDVLLPPAPPPMRRPAPPMQQSVAKRPVQTHPRRPVSRRAPSAAPPLVQPAPAMARPAPPSFSTAAPAIASPSAQRSTHGVDSAAIARWAKPSTLRTQFILTEIFQPPLALREPR